MSKLIKPHFKKKKTGSQEEFIMSLNKEYDYPNPILRVVRLAG